MTRSMETEYLLRQPNKNCRDQKLYVFLIISVTLVVLSILVAGLLLGYICWERSNYDNEKVVHLKNVLPSSHGVVFKVSAENSSAYISTDDIKIKWEIEPNSLRYQQEIEDTTGNENIFTTVSIMDQRAVISYRLDNETTWTCARDLKIFQWFSILRVMMDSVQSYSTEEDCPEYVWKVQYEGKPVSICFTDSQITYIRHGNKLAKLEEWSTPSRSSIKLPQVAPSCEVKYSQVHSLNMPKYDHQPNISESVNNTGAFHYEALIRSDLLTRSNKPDCLFVHGIGVETPKTGFNVLKSMDYWGHIEKDTPQCSSHRFIQFNTVDNGWDSTALHQMFCKFATGSESGGKISNKMIFSHSMGNNIVAAALYRKTCTFDKITSKWFAVSAPWKGSKVVDTLEALCAGYINSKHSFKIPRVVTYVLRHTKYCLKNGKMSPAYRTLAPAYKSKTGITYEDLVSQARQYVKGALCGTSPWGIGLNLVFSEALKLIQEYTNLEKPNDGVVALNSCDIFGERFQNSAVSKFYKAPINHHESSTREGCPDIICGWYKHL
ncbi:uncharacterized protein LOC132552639 [Ylistrum balloti]|uniref:uncharacterized protein LOC132552639 n=1 Tax=Ylistrum balloti TaxID=509963 RepID=UPI0029058458|nr:uncharacterized protein LOC132552639 [Ylistrum balloti]